MHKKPTPALSKAIKNQESKATSSATSNANATSNGKLHPRNRHNGRYDFNQLIHVETSLRDFVRVDEFGEQGIDFANKQAVKALNRALLKESYGIVDWDIPEGNLCPPVPGRADYVHYLADLLASSNNGKIPKKKHIQVLDIGTGANCIYPIIGTSEYAWNFVGSDINAASLANAQKIIDANPSLSQQITLRLQSTSNAIFKGIVQSDEWFDLSMCNPPFHTSLAQAKEGSERKWHNLGKALPSNKKQAEEVNLNFGGQEAELWCPGGELAFIQRMIKESTQIPTQCFWFSSLVSKSANLAEIEASLKHAKVLQHKTINMSQGQKQSRLVAWTFLNPAQQAPWRKLRW